jgi:glycosyltransferase involved in cell wall biosynthesis
MKSSKKLGIYSPYLDTLGGGERYLAGIAKVFGDLGFQVEWWWPNTKILSQLSARFGMSLKKSRVNPQAHAIQTQGNWLDKFQLHRQYHSLFFVSDGSVPMLFSKKSYIHLQVPFANVKKPSLINRIKLWKASEIICNSSFTKKIIDASFLVNAQVLYPPVTQIKPLKKRNLILSVGRFDSPMHPKRQDVLINAFLSLNLTDWELVLAGGCLDTTALEPLTLLANQSPQITILPNPSHAALHKLYAQSKIYWHAAGFGASSSEPYKAEHFGIAIVEAMSAGAVPIAYKMGGPLEIIDQAHTGYLWETLEQLQKLTRDMTYHEDKARVLSANAQKHARIFSEEAFGANLTAIIS